MSDRAFDEMPGAIQLMFRAEVGPPLGRFDEREEGVQVAVGLLRCGDEVDRVGHLLLQGRVRMRGQRVGRPFQQLIHVGIVEENAFELTLHAAGRLGEVDQPAGRLAVLEIVSDGLLAIGFDARRPERILHLDGRKRHGQQLAIFRRRGLGPSLVPDQRQTGTPTTMFASQFSR